MWRWGALAAVVVAVVVVVLLTTSGDSGDAQPAAATAAPNVVQAGAPGEASRELSEEELAEIETPKHTAADAEFVRGMIHHHAQALEMTGYVPDRGVGRDIELISKRMELSQESEIELMEQWLKDRGEEVPSESEHSHGHGGELMPGMLTDAELAELEAAEGRAFNRLFYRGMIRHHQGAFTMIEELHGKNGGAEAELDNLIRHIEADQSIEIERMEQLLASR